MDQNQDILDNEAFVENNVNANKDHPKFDLFFVFPAFFVRKFNNKCRNGHYSAVLASWVYTSYKNYGKTKWFSRQTKVLKVKFLLYYSDF